MACKVIRNDEDTIVSVLAPNGNQSILFNNILNDIKDSEEALLEYSTTYTDGFKSILDTTFTNIDQQELYDQNGEVKFEIYNKIMNPELTLLKGKLYGSMISQEIEGKLEANKDRLIELLGSSMYSEKLKDVVYKELLQNAFDATKIAESKGLIDKGKIDIEIDEKERIISFKDNGIGMTPEIVQKAFFTIGGTYKGEDVDNKLKSGGLGLAKMAFIFGSEKLNLETVNNGIKTTVDATSEEIRKDNFKIKTESTTEKNGTKISVKIPKTYIDSRGESRQIDFPQYSDIEFKYSFLSNPLIGNVDINYSIVNRDASYKDDFKIKTNLGSLPEGFVLFSPAKTSFADMDIYIDTKNITRGSFVDTKHKILSSGLYQFDVSFKKDDDENIPLNIIIDIKPKVDPTNAQYPFNNQRENFKPTVKNDIGALNKYLALLWKSIEIELLKSSFNKIKNIEAVDVQNVDDSIINKNKEITKSFTSLSNSEIIKNVIDDFNKKNKEAIITDGGLKTKELSLTKEDIDKDKEKVYGKTFKAEKEISVNKETGLNLDSNKPIIHNNTNITLDDKSTKFLSEISSIMLEYKKSIIDFYGQNYSDNLKDQLWGVSIDKSYGGVNVNPSFLNMLAINPFYNFPDNPKVDAVNYIAVALDHLIIHELNHNFVRNEGAQFTGRFLQTYSEIHSLPNHFELVSKLKLSIKNNLETIKKLNYEYQQSENVESGFEGNKIEKDNKKGTDRRTETLSNIDSTINDRTDKYDTRSSEKFGEIIKGFQEIKPGESEDFVAENEIAFATVKKIADSFSKRFGIAYNILDESEARKMLNEAGFEYNNEPAFFFNGEVYITTGNFNPKNVIHEFSHPFIKAIAKNNPALFNKLYNELSKTEEGKAIIKYVEEKYKDKNVEGRKEEVLVRALTQQALNKSTFTESTPAFTKIINKILYHIKQLMRKVFGKIKIESLNVDTTLEELSEMLTTESLNLSIKDAIGNGVEFNRETGREAANYLKKTERIKLEQGINTFFDLLKKNSSIIRDGLTQDNDLYEVFVDSELEKGRIFSDTIRSLSKYTTLDSTDPAAIDDALKFRELQITAFINSLVEYEDAVDRIGEEISRIRSSTDPNEFAITRLDYLKRILKTTLQTTDQIKKDMVEQNVPVNSPVFKLVNELEDKSKIGVNSIYNYFEKVLPPILAPQLEGTNKMIIKQYDQKIDDLRKKGANAEIINKLEKEKQSYLRDENYLARAIIGTEPEPALLGISAFVESAISSPDGLISSFAKMVKATMIDVDLNAKKNADEFFDAVNPLIEEANVNFNTISEAGNKMTTVQEKGYTDPTTGEYTTRKVVEFLNPFKDHQLVLSKFSFEIREAIKEKDSDKLVEIKKRKKMFYRQYMHNEFLPIVYTADDIFERTYLDSTGVVHEVGRIAKERRDKILEFIAAENSIIRDELEKLEISSRMKADSLWSDYYALYSKYTPDGKIKDEVELAITNVLLENRKKRMEFYAWESDEVVDSMPIKRFEKARKLFKERLQTKYAEDSKEYKEKLAEWDRVNTRTVIDKKFYADRQIILDEIKDIYNQIAATKLLSKEDEEKILKSQNKIQKNMEEILDQMYGYRDEENHPNGLLISEEKVARLKVIQEEINILREALRNGEGLSKTEKLEMQKLLDKEDEEGLTDEESERLDFLDTQNIFSNVPKALKKKLAAKFKELNEIQGKYSTKYYMIAYNYQLERVNERLRAAGASDRKLIKLLDSLNVDELGLDQGFLNKAFKDKAFKTWFEKNHVLAIVFDSVSERYEQKYQRLPIWNEIRPQNEAKYLRKMVLSDGETIYGLPTLNYYRQNVKPEYITPEIDENGLPTRDVNGRFLPRFIPNSPYINQEYFDLKTKDEKLFDLLNKITEMHLKFQQKDDEGGRLGYEVPRFERSSKELTETTAFLSGKVSGAKAVVKNIINKFRSNPEDFDEGLSTEDKFTLISLDQFDDDDGKIHIAGKAYLDDDQVSRDVITSVLRHMWGIERFSELKKIHPVAKALNDTLQNPKNFPVDNKKGMGNLIDKASRVFTRGKTEGSRAKAVKGLVEKNFYNIQQTGLGSDTVFLQKLSRYMMAGASFGFFALDVVSALKNRFGQQIQQTVELAAGTSYDAKSFLKGKITASKAMMEITGSIYSRGKLPLLAQMVDIFDPVQGRFYEKFAERMTRTVFKDAARPLNATMSPRKFLELEVGLEFFFGVMEFTKVERTIGATTELIPYTEAFELVDGKIKLRSGIDPKYDIGGSEFKRIRLFIQEKQNILNGVYAMFDQPEGARYLFYRMYLFLRKFFVTGFMNRFGFSGSIFKPRYRRNEATENLEMGYWINTLDAIIQMLRTGGRHMHYMLPQQRKATYKFLSELAILAIASMVIPWILGWDDDDDERYEKLRERQGGPLGSEDFKLGGWLANHMLYQAIAVSSENSQFYTVKFYSEMLGDFNLANGPTLEMYAKMLNNGYLWATDDPGAYYKKDVGPYPWQKAESAKILNNIGKAFALTGKNIDPAKAVQDMISIQTIK